MTVPYAVDLAQKVIKKSNSAELNELLKKFVTDEYIETDETLRVPLSYSISNEKILYNPKHPNWSAYDPVESITHEIVHLIDVENGVSVSLAGEIFKAAESSKSLILKSRDYYEKLLEGKLGENMSISDLVAAITDSELYGFFAHEKDYWQELGNREREIVANMMTAYYMKEVEALKFIESITSLKSLLEELKRRYGIICAETTGRNN